MAAASALAGGGLVLSSGPAGAAVQTIDQHPGAAGPATGTTIASILGSAGPGNSVGGFALLGLGGEIGRAHV